MNNYRSPIILLTVLIALTVSGCNFPVSVEENDKSEARQNAQMVRNLIEEYNPSSAVLVIREDFDNSTDLFEVEGIHFVDKEENKKYNLGDLISAYVDDPRVLRLQF